MYSVVDISDYKLVLPLPALGYMEKLWLRDSAQILWLQKYASDEKPSDAVNEKICCELAKFWGLPFQEVELSIDDECRLGCLCRNFVSSNQRLVHGGRLLSNIVGVKTSSPDFKVIDQKYTFQLVASAIPNLLPEFIINLCFVNLVGNVDFHDKNWSVLTEPRKEDVLAPNYDFGLAFFPAQETRDTWFNDLGWESNGVVEFNTLFKRLCQVYPAYVSDFMTRLNSPEFLPFAKGIFEQIPNEFSEVITHQHSFLINRRKKMITVWEVCNRGKDNLSQTGLSGTDVFSR